jgi:hypothetical protein
MTYYFYRKGEYIMEIYVTARVVRLCKKGLGTRNVVCVRNHKLHVESPYEKEEDLVCEVLIDFLYRNYYKKKGMYAFPQDMLIDLFGIQGFNLLRYNYAIEYAGELRGQRMWML